MVAPKSPHLPEVAGEIVSVTGSLDVDTGLRDVQGFNVTLAQASAAAAAGVNGVLQPIIAGQTLHLRLQVWQADGATPSAVAAQVSWTAIGK